MFPYIETENGFQTLINNRSYAVAHDHQHYDELQAAVLEGEEEVFLSLFSSEKKVEENFQDTAVTVKHGVVFYGDNPVHNVVADKIISMSERGLNPEPMINFLGNLMKNPSYRAVNELYNFLQHRKLPITEDGCFLAYKSVRQNWTDKHTGTIMNTIGSVVEIPRNQVDENMNSHCSHGLHVGALEYAGPGGWYNNSNDRVIIVKVNPADAVSVPNDHNFTKLRVCRYEVLSEYNQELDEDVYPAPLAEKECSFCATYEEICIHCSEFESECECEYKDEW